jgi:hypothetical protein
LFFIHEQELSTLNGIIPLHYAIEKVREKGVDNVRFDSPYATAKDLFKNTLVADKIVVPEIIITPVIAPSKFEKSEDVEDTTIDDLFDDKEIIILKLIFI